MNNRRKRRSKIRRVFVPLFLIIVIIVVSFCINPSAVTAYEKRHYNRSMKQHELFASSLCVADENVSLESFQTEDKLGAGGLFEVKQQKVCYAKDIHKRVYPASLTKILTFYLALEYGNLSDVVTISKNATSVPADSSSANLRVGDQLTLLDLLYALMLPSGNDSAVAIAEHISGSVEDFVLLMNEEARKMGATHTNFTNPHGYHDEEHYTTAYDLYLMFQKCIEKKEFVKVISAKDYQVKITKADGNTRTVTWKQSNQYVNGLQETPENVTILGGKTGTTNAAKACLILYCKDQHLNPYISIIMGSETRTDLYANMTALISTIAD